MALPIPRWLSAVLTSAALVAAVTAVIALLEPQVPALGLGVLYLLVVVPIALVYGGAVAAVVSVASMMAFSFYFLPPLHSLDPGTPERWAVLLAFVTSSLVVGQLAARSQREVRRSARLADEQAALRRVATLVAEGAPAARVLSAVAEEIGQLLTFDTTVVHRFDAEGIATVVARHGLMGDELAVGLRRKPEPGSALAAVLQMGQSARVDDYGDVSEPLAELVHRMEVRSSVASPVVVEGRLWGAISVGSRSEQLPADTEQRLANFTDLVSAAIANAESRAGLNRLAEEQAALRRVATLVARGVPAEDLFAAVAEEVGQLVSIDGTMILRYGADGTATVIAGWSRSVEVPPELQVGASQAPEGESVSVQVFRTGRPARVDSYANATGDMSKALHGTGVRSAVGAPIVVEGRLWGVVAAGSMKPEPLPSGMEFRLAEFTDIVATAIANAEGRAELTASRARVVAASDETRRQIERDLHDGTQQRLVSLSLGLRAAQAKVPAELGDVRAELSRTASGLADAVEDLQEISRGIHPAILSRGGLAPALEALAGRAAVPVKLETRLHRRLPEPVEVALYYVVSEALTNAAKHAQASVVHVGLKAEDSLVALAIRDDGVGGADPARGSGLVGLRDRVEALGGTIEIASSPGLGTSLLARIPTDGIDASS